MLKVTILQNEQTGRCIIEDRFTDGSCHVDGFYSLATAKYLAGRRARIERVAPWSDAWREARTLMDDD